MGDVRLHWNPMKIFNWVSEEALMLINDVLDEYSKNLLTPMPPISKQLVDQPLVYE